MKSAIHKETKPKPIRNFLSAAANWVYNACKSFASPEATEKVVTPILPVSASEVPGVFAKRTFDVVCVVMLNSD